MDMRTNCTGISENKTQELNGTKQHKLHALITSWITYALRRSVINFCYNSYRKMSQLRKSSFQVTGCSSRNRSTVYHSIRNVCVVGTSASMSNNYRDHWRCLSVHMTIERCHSPDGSKTIKTCCTELLRGFFLLFGKLQGVLYRSHLPLTVLQTPPLTLLPDEGTLFQHVGHFWLFLSLFF